MRRRTFCTSALAYISTMPLALRAFAASGAEASAEIPVIRRQGGEGFVSRKDCDDLRASLRGALLLSSDPGYDNARHLWNGAFDRHPAMIAKCAAAADVIQAVNFARAHDLLVAVRGGGHSFSGQSACDKGLMIDLSLMHSVHVDPVLRRARVEPGAMLGEFDREAQSFGLVTTAGTVSHTGVAGLTLGGGFGRLARRFGLACDNLRAADVVTADGRLVETSANENPDLLWGLRGGGGNFGIVTSFEYGLHPAGPIMYGGDLLFAASDARAMLTQFAGFAAEAPDEMYVAGGMWTDEKLGPIVGFNICYCGRPEDGERAIAPLRAFRKPVRDRLGPTPYVRMQTDFDATYPWGWGYYERSGFIKKLTPEVIDSVIAIMDAPYPADADIYFVHQGGAIARTKPEATAFWHRDPLFALLIETDWHDPSDGRARDESMQWARTQWAALQKFTDGFYVNELSADDPHARVRSTYGGNYTRLVQLKKKYDPKNLFHMNANVPPSEV